MYGDFPQRGQLMQATIPQTDRKATRKERPGLKKNRAPPFSRKAAMRNDRNHLNLTTTELDLEVMSDAPNQVEACNLAMEQIGRLTVKLRGRATRPDQRRGRILFSRARGAHPPPRHGPLERLLEVTLTDHHCARAAPAPQANAKRSRVKRAPARQLTESIHACLTAA